MPEGDARGTLNLQPKRFFPSVHCTRLLFVRILWFIGNKRVKALSSRVNHSILLVFAGLECRVRKGAGSQLVVSCATTISLGGSNSKFYRGLSKAALACVFTSGTLTVYVLVRVSGIRTARHGAQRSFLSWIQNKCSQGSSWRVEPSAHAQKGIHRIRT